MRYLLDTNVVSEIQKGRAAHKNVRLWLDSVDDDAVWLSVMTLREVNRGIAKREREAPNHAAALRASYEELRTAYAGQVVEVDGEIAEEWGRLQGMKDKDRDDLAFAATARVRGMVLVTRNVKDFRGRGVRVLDPFKASPAIEEV